MKALVCSVCGYVHLQDIAPDKCPICGAPSKAFILKEDALKTKDDIVTIGETEKKHLPFITIEEKNCCSDQGCKEVRVQIGEITHPMKPEHFIFKIVFYADKNFIGHTSLTPSLNPVGVVCLGNLEYKKISVVAHCNIHGNWISEI
jgi:superoxide reductase